MAMRRRSKLVIAGVVLAPVVLVALLPTLAGLGPGAELEVVGTVEAAAERGREAEVDLVVTDVGVGAGASRLLDALRRDGPPVVVAGAETDVCVMQSCFGLLEMGFEVFLLEDCVFSNEANVGPALRRMQQAGVVPTTFKTYFYEMEVGVGRERERSGARSRAVDLAELRGELGIPGRCRDAALEPRRARDDVVGGEGAERQVVRSPQGDRQPPVVERVDRLGASGQYPQARQARVLRGAPGEQHVGHPQR